MPDKVTGQLEVGRNDNNEIVINQFQVTPDENGVHHLVFSPNQARDLATLLTKHANDADWDRRKFEDEQKRKAAEAIPVNPTARVLTNGLTEDQMPDYKELGALGQQKAYVVLSLEERAKGFVRPVRSTYKHVGRPGPKYPTRNLTTEEHVRYFECDYVLFEEYPEEEKRGVGRYWTSEQLSRVGQACGTTTTMGRALAETYARSPGFYGGTFCSNCGDHYPVGEDGEFIWLDDGTRVGT